MPTFVADPLLQRVAATVRPASAQKPVVAEFRARGVEVREADVEVDSADKLKAVLSGVDILISAVQVSVLEQQKILFTAAKEVGVKRVIPCDFGTPGARGVRPMSDIKFDIRDSVQALGVGYTFIDVGWWMQLSLPYKPDSQSLLAPWSHNIYGDGTQKFLVTDYHNIGKFVARVVADDRTLNQYVIVWEDEITQLEAAEIGEHASGEAAEMKAQRVQISAEEVAQRIATANEEYAKTGAYEAYMARGWFGYMHSIHFLGENTLANAKALGALDVRELYPDLLPSSFEKWAPKFYEGDAVY